jgi:hypothetical protein
MTRHLLACVGSWRLPGRPLHPGTSGPPEPLGVGRVGGPGPDATAKMTMFGHHRSARRRGARAGLPGAYGTRTADGPGTAAAGGRVARRAAAPRRGSRCVLAGPDDPAASRFRRRRGHSGQGGLGGGYAPLLLRRSLAHTCDTPPPAVHDVSVACLLVSTLLCRRSRSA